MLRITMDGASRAGLQPGIETLQPLILRGLGTHLGYREPIEI